MTDLARLAEDLERHVREVRGQLLRDMHRDKMPGPPELIRDPSGRFILLDAVVALANVRLALRHDTTS